MKMPRTECRDCAEYGSEFCDECLKEKEMKEKHPNCGTPDCCGECNQVHEMMTTADAGIPQDTKNMGPRVAVDKRKKKQPILLKRFRKYMEENA
jgi:hypothetical protein